MKTVIQRVSRASVSIGGEEHASIGRGLMVLVGVCDSDGDREIACLCSKLVNLRIFADEEGKMNRSLLDEGGEMLIVSNFTLYADCKKGRRPSYVKAGSPALAKERYDAFVTQMRQTGIGSVKTGEFGADMELTIVNDGPVTIILDTDELL